MAGRSFVRSEESLSNTSTTFAFTVAVLSCVYNLLVAVTCDYLPNDPLGIRFGITLYSWSGVILSIVGAAGIVAKRPALATSFAHFLIIDTFVSAICRLLVLQFFIEAFYDYNICSDGYEPHWDAENFRHDIVTSVRWQQENLWHSSHKRRCRVALGAVQVVLVCALLGLTAAQGSLAVMIRRHAKEMEVPEPRRVGKPRRSPHPEEKLHLFVSERAIELP